MKNREEGKLQQDLHPEGPRGTLRIQIHLYLQCNTAQTEKLSLRTAEDKRHLSPVQVSLSDSSLRLETCR